MNILCLDTSTEVLSIGLKTDSSFEERLIDGNFSHSENLMEEMTSILKRAKLELRDLDLLITTKGPGSFTGLRVALATLKGIRSASGAKLVSVPTLDVMIESNRHHGIADMAVIDAKKQRFYIRIEKDDKVLCNTIDGNPSDILEILNGEKEIAVTGKDATKFVNKALQEGACCNFSIDRFAPRNLSKALLKLGLEQFEKYGEDEIGTGPMYIRRSDAEEALLKKIREKTNETN